MGMLQCPPTNPTPCSPHPQQTLNPALLTIAEDHDGGDAAVAVVGGHLGALGGDHLPLPGGRVGWWGGGARASAVDGCGVWGQSETVEPACCSLLPRCSSPGCRWRAAPSPPTLPRQQHPAVRTQPPTSTRHQHPPVRTTHQHPPVRTQPPTPHAHTHCQQLALVLRCLTPTQPASPPPTPSHTRYPAHRQQPALVLRSQLVDEGGDHAAGAAPGGPEVNLHSAGK